MALSPTVGQKESLKKDTDNDFIKVIFFAIVLKCELVTQYFIGNVFSSLSYSGVNWVCEDNRHKNSSWTYL